MSLDLDPVKILELVTTKRSKVDLKLRRINQVWGHVIHPSGDAKNDKVDLDLNESQAQHFTCRLRQRNATEMFFVCCEST